MEEHSGITKQLEQARLIRLVKNADGYIDKTETDAGYKSFYTFGFFDELRYIKAPSGSFFRIMNVLI